MRSTEYCATTVHAKNIKDMENTLERKHTRKLASFQKILEIHPIEGADVIERVRVNGWNVVVKKEDGFKTGEMVVYIEIDSMLPIVEGFEWLRKSCYRKLADGTEGFRIKTMKLRGIYSQGLVLSVFDLHSLGFGKYNEYEWPMNHELGKFFTFNDGEEVDLSSCEEMDITERLGIFKYEPPIPACLEGQKLADTPGYLVTDETRCQNLQLMLTKYKGKKCYKAEKLDGSSFIAYLDEYGEMHVCSRGNDWLPESDNSQWKWAIANNLKQKLQALTFRACLSGEIIGEGVQGNPYKMIGQHVYFFDVRNLDTMEYLGYEEFKEIIRFIGLKTVPILDDCFELIDDIDELLSTADGPSVLNSKTKREGIVIRPLETIMDPNFDVPHSRVSLKVIGNKFLLNKEE